MSSPSLQEFFIVWVFRTLVWIGNNKQKLQRKIVGCAELKDYYMVCFALFIKELTIHIDLKEQVQKRRQMLYLHYLYMI